MYIAIGVWSVICSKCCL